jgi:prefoldin beta subunit
LHSVPTIELQTSQENLRHLTAQKSENESVKAEFLKMEPDAVIWKLVGPLLVKQDSSEALSNIEKRMEFIEAELTKAKTTIASFENEFETKRREFVQIQSELQTATTKA